MKTFLASLLLLACVSAASATTLSLTAENGWIRSAPPGATMLAGYLQLSNTGDTQLSVVGARSDAFDAVELHRSIEEDGVARMRPVDLIVIPPGQTVALEPGGLHLMLMRPKKKLIVGDSVVVDLLTADDEALPVVLQLRSMPPGDGHDHSHHHHGH
jgi:periplasmic copper chaperone A